MLLKKINKHNADKEKYLNGSLAVFTWNSALSRRCCPSPAHKVNMFQQGF